MRTTQSTRPGGQIQKRMAPPLRTGVEEIKYIIKNKSPPIAIVKKCADVHPQALLYLKEGGAEEDRGVTVFSESG